MMRCDGEERGRSTSRSRSRSRSLSRSRSPPAPLSCSRSRSDFEEGSEGESLGLLGGCDAFPSYVGLLLCTMLFGNLSLPLFTLLPLGCGQSIRTGEGQLRSRGGGSGSVLTEGIGRPVGPTPLLEFVRIRLLPLVSSELELGSISEAGLALRFPAEDGLALMSSVLLLGGVRRSDGVWLPLRPLLFEAARVLLLVVPLLSDELLFSLIGIEANMYLKVQLHTSKFVH
ncbi:hypothetical protein EYF80_023806 [Liparis tanakae]|uniref:Uncharacterized protein n=1 Tax=Liparis tanakae TaxID=230148 RepID=A0A4Z2HLR7_9TELE|nr:hypothetical protein EYF80_023806 [Liparis tanakae]